MYFRLTGAMKDRFILELRRFWATHPKYRDIVDRIQGKYSFKERPQYGIVVKTGSGTRVDLSPDNYIGVVVSYVYMTKVQNYPGLSIEWVREDSVAIQNNNGAFPSPPGIYYVEMTEDEEFWVDPLYDVYHEQVTLVSPTSAQLQNVPLTGTLRLYEMPAGYQLVEGVNYTLGQAGDITLVQPVTGGRSLVADYRWPGQSMGPFRIKTPCGVNNAIPGVVLAFGRRNEKGDRMAIVVQDRRSPASLEYGGRWDVTLDFDVVSRDVFAQQEIADQTVIYLWGVLRPYLSSEGIEMTDISLGGESEEVADETGDDYFYNSSFSITVQTEWSVHIPLDAYLRAVVPLTQEQARVAAGMTDEQVAAVQSNIRMLESLGLELIRDPFFRDRTLDFEVVR